VNANQKTGMEKKGLEKVFKGGKFEKDPKQRKKRSRSGKKSRKGLRFFRSKNPTRLEEKRFLGKIAWGA